jgi:hypothetical protein
MVMDEEREDGGGEEALEEINVLGESNQPEKLNVVQEIVGVIESVAQFGDYRRTQKKECYGVVRRMKHLLPLFEEIRDLERSIPETGIAWLCNLKKALLLAKKLLKTCNEGSKIYLVRILKLFEAFL